MAPSSYVGFAGIWSMDLGAAVPRAESSFSTETTAESIFDPDYRSLVDENDYKDGGKYRCEYRHLPFLLAIYPQ